MLPALGLLASTAASTLVTLMATDAWQEARKGMIDVWRRRQPQEAARIAEDLDGACVAIRQARQSVDSRGETAVAAEWHRRILALLTREPAAADDVVQLMERLRPQAAPYRVSQEARAGHSATVNQAGRDINQSGRDLWIRR
jgi:hypothetical protein